MGKIEEQWVTTTDQQQMHTWWYIRLISTPKRNTQPSCIARVDRNLSVSFGRIAEFQLMAANGYIIVAPNRRWVIWLWTRG